MLPAVGIPSAANVQTGSSNKRKLPLGKDGYDFPIPKVINYIWYGKTFEKFDQLPIQECVKNNPDYRVRLWLDDFSMLEQYDNPKMFPPASLEIHTSGTDISGSSASIDTFFALLVGGQMEYYKVRPRNHARANYPTILKFHEFLQQNSLHNVEIAFLAEFYEVLFQAQKPNFPDPEIQLLRWMFFERNRKNYAAASNLLRVQMLQTYPGIYVDHHTTVPSLGNLTGFRFALTAERTASQSFLASARDHPCLQYFRYCILENYDPPPGKKPTEPTDLQNPYTAENHSLSGAGAFIMAMKDVAEGIARKTDISEAGMTEVVVNARAVKARILAGKAE